MGFFVHLGVRTRLVRRDVLNAELVALEILAVKELLASGTVHQAWKRTDGHAVVLLIGANSDSECRAILARLPFSKAGVLDIQQIVPVEPYLEVFAESPPPQSAVPPGSANLS